MCQEIHVSDVRSALLDLSDENDDEPLPPVDLLTRFDDWLDDHFAHAFDHRRRARELALSGDEDGAAIHKALLANMTRVPLASFQTSVLGTDVKSDACG